jgi:hypothetical protein
MSNKLLKLLEKVRNFITETWSRWLIGVVVNEILLFNYDQTILDLVACSFSTIDPKLGVTLSNLTKQTRLSWDKKLKASTWQVGQNVENSL